MSIRANGEGSPELIGFACQFAGRSQDRALGVMHFEAQFAAHALGSSIVRARANKD
jgi:hypothetical protein